MLVLDGSKPYIFDGLVMKQKSNDLELSIDNIIEKEGQNW